MKNFLPCVLLVCIFPAGGRAEVNAAARALGPRPVAMLAYEDMDLVDEMPLDASISLTFIFNHANFVPGERNARWDLAAPEYGWSFIEANVSIGYWVTRRISAGASLAVDKAITGDFTGPGDGARTWRATQLGDLRLRAGGLISEALRQKKITTAWGVAMSLPTSKASRAGGVVLRASPSLRVARKFGPVDVGLSGNYTWSWFSHPTQRIICEAAPDACRISGDDLGQPNVAHSLSGSLSLSYPLRSWIDVSIAYSVSSSIGAVAFPEDERTSDVAQVGYQFGGLRQQFALNLSVLIFDSTRLGAQMSTYDFFWTGDGQSWRVPFFDLESQLHHHTVYSVGIGMDF